MLFFLGQLKYPINKNTSNNHTTNNGSTNNVHH